MLGRSLFALEHNYILNFYLHTLISDISQQIATQNASIPAFSFSVAKKGSQWAYFTQTGVCESVLLLLHGLMFLLLC